MPTFILSGETYPPSIVTKQDGKDELEWEGNWMARVGTTIALGT